MVGYSGVNNMSMYQEGQQTLIQQPQEPVLEDAAFEEAFLKAKAEIEMQESAELQRAKVGQDLDQDHALKHFAASDLPIEGHAQIRIGSDAIEYREKEISQDTDGDELAKTAGQLLESVSHDQSQKFRESSFLALMRRIRDREVKVDGDEFRNVSTSPAPVPAPSSPASTLPTRAAADHLQFYPI